MALGMKRIWLALRVPIYCPSFSQYTRNLQPSRRDQNSACRTSLHLIRTYGPWPGLSWRQAVRPRERLVSWPSSSTAPWHPSKPFLLLCAKQDSPTCKFRGAQGDLRYYLYLPLVNCLIKSNRYDQNNAVVPIIWWDNVISLNTMRLGLLAALHREVRGQGQLENSSHGNSCSGWIFDILDLSYTRLRSPHWSKIWGCVCVHELKIYKFSSYQHLQTWRQYTWYEWTIWSRSYAAALWTRQ